MDTYAQYKREIEITLKKITLEEYITLETWEQRRILDLIKTYAGDKILLLPSEEIELIKILTYNIKNVLDIEN